MAGSNDANIVPEGTTFIFSSWACTADRSGGFINHLITPEEPKATIDDQLVETAAEFGEKPSTQASPTPNSKSAGNVPTPTRLGGSAESNFTPNSKNFQFSETLEKYVAYLKSIKRPKVVNSELLDGIDRVSRSIEGCIKLAESVLGTNKIHQNPENSNPRRDRTGDMLSGID